MYDLLRMFRNKLHALSEMYDFMSVCLEIIFEEENNFLIHCEKLETLVFFFI